MKASQVSKDGKWRSYPTPGLVRYEPSKVFYARLRIRGKLRWKSLETTRLDVAKTKLAEQRREWEGYVPPPNGAPLTFAEAAHAHLEGTRNRHDLKPRTVRYYEDCVRLLRITWDGDLDNLRLSRIRKEDCAAWAKRFAEDYSATLFNNTLHTLKVILELGGISPNPAAGIARRGARSKEPSLPDKETFLKLLREIERVRGRRHRDFVEFLAYSGARLQEAAGALWKDVDFDRGELILKTAKRRSTSSAPIIRRVSFNRSLKVLLIRLKGEGEPDPESRILVARESKMAIARACKNLKIPHLSHHSFRHLFITRCLESGVPVPTLAKWVGHLDGGALLLKTYSHLLPDHSQAMAAKVGF